MGYFLSHNTSVDAIDMTEAGRRVGVSREGIRRALQKAGVTLYPIGRSFAVEVIAFEKYVQERGGIDSFKVGRPPKPRPDTEGE